MKHKATITIATDGPQGKTAEFSVLFDPPIETSKEPTTVSLFAAVMIQAAKNLSQVATTQEGPEVVNQQPY